MSLKDAKTRTGIISSLITLVVVGLLIFAGPAQAFLVSLGNFSNSNPFMGEIVYLDASLKINSNEIVKIDYMNLSYEGGFCLFNAYNGSKIGGDCSFIEDINVLLANASYGYGYGYAYGYNYGYGYHQGYSDGVFKYNISINTSVLGGGEHNFVISAKLGPKVYNSETKTLSVKGAFVVEGPEGIGGNWSIPGGSTPENAPNLTLIGDLVIDLSDGNYVILKNGTVITASDGGNLNLISLSASLANLSQLIGLEGVVGALQFGIPNFGLEFNPSMKIKINVSEDYEGQTLGIYRSLNGSGGWTQDGLLNTSCVVSGEVCEFETEKASYFAVVGPTSTTSSVVAATFVSGGGYCSTKWTCSEWSVCENGIQTRTCSYPANFCAPNDPKPEEVRSCNVGTQTNNPQEEKTENEGEKVGRSLFTGFVVGLGDIVNDPIKGTAALILILVVLGAVVWIIRKRKLSLSKKAK